jgi:drug/metabolite transporter (DMT)-like permease
MTSPIQTTGATSISFIVTLLAATFLMGSSFVAAKVLLTDGFTPMILVGWRFFVAALATLPLLLLEQRNPFKALIPKGISLRDALIVVVIGLLQTAAVMGLLFLAMRSISASTAAILLFTNPIWVAVLGRILLKESLHGVRVVGLLLGIIGVSMAIGLGANAASPDVLAGELIGLGSAFCWAAATIINKRANLTLGSWTLSFWQMFIGSIALLAIAYGNGESWPEVTTNAQWGWFFWLAIPASTGSFGLWFAALKKGGATKTSGYLFLAPIFTVLLSLLIFGKSLTWVQAAGGVLIGMALWMVNREMPGRTSQEQLNEALVKGEP